MITGKNLIALGYTPNKLFGKALEHINKYNLSEKDIHDFLKEFFKPSEVIEPFEKPGDYIINLETNNEDETNNLSAISLFVKPSAISFTISISRLLKFTGLQQLATLFTSI